MTRFSDLEAPRWVEHCDDLRVIVILAVICGANDCAVLAEFGQTRQDWLLAGFGQTRQDCLRTSFVLPHEIPPHHTFNRMLTLLNPHEFQCGLQNCRSSLVALVTGEVVALDGEVLRRSQARVARNRRTTL